ncbi:MAG: methenyltetrahydromethanopterin cyclohydrolase [Pirellulaceae bacterium]
MSRTSLENLNLRSRQLIERLGGSRLDELDVRVIAGPLGCIILDFGVDRLGTIAAGKILAEICLADLAKVSIEPSNRAEWPMPIVAVETDHPLSACIASQYAGWPVSADGYFAMASGPARLLRGKEDILARYGLAEVATQGVVILESGGLPTESALEKMGLECQLAPNELTLCIARTASLPGTLQIVARCIETTLHKLFELNFDLTQVVRAYGTCPLPPIGRSDLQSVGWTNDAIILASDVTLWVDCADSRVEEVGERLPSSSSQDFGRPFIEIFQAYERDFYRIDKMLFSPARVTFNNVQSGRVFQFGQQHFELLRKSVGLTAED